MCLFNFSSIYHENYIIYGNAVWKINKVLSKTTSKALLSYLRPTDGVCSACLLGDMDFSSSGLSPLF
jgi:hypothetical protein